MDHYYSKGEQHREKVGRKSDALKLEGVEKLMRLLTQAAAALNQQSGHASDLIDDVLEYVAHHKDRRNYISKASIVGQKFGTTNASDIKPEDIER